jgi:transposase-like protein
LEISLSEKFQNVYVNEKWGQEIFIDGLAQYIREFLKHAFEETIRLELQEMLGRKPYERTESTNNYRNGSYDRDLETRFGVIEDIKVARDRNGEFYPRVLERYRRREEKIDQRIIELFIGGISTRKMKKITRDLFGKGYSASTISKINKQLTEEMRAWMEAPIEDNIKYIYLDGLNLPVKRFAVSKESLLMAIGITTDGYRVILAVQLGDRESASSWLEFLKDLKRRGLKGEHLELGIMDGLTGLENVFLECFPKAKTQRCVVHKLRNIAAKLPRKIQKDCLNHVKRVFYANSYDEALNRFNDWKSHWDKVAPGAVHCLEKDLDSVLQFYHFPKHHWKIIRTTNIIERTFKEFRRRTRQMDSLPNEDCCLRCVYAIASNLNDCWANRKVDGFSPRRKENAGAA